MLKAIVKFLKVLNSNSHPGEIAHGVCLGMILGFLPKDNLFWYVLAVLFVFLRIHRGCLAIFTFIFALLAPMFDPLFDKLGYAFLTIDSFNGVFGFIMDIPFMAFTHLNNSIVMGAFLFSLIIYVPVYFISRGILHLWRRFGAPKIRKTKLITVVTKIPLVKKMTELGDML